MARLGRLQGFGSHPIGLWIIKHIVSPLDRIVVRASLGRLPPPSRIAVPSLLLTVVGSKSGREHTIPLVYVLDGSRYIVANARPVGERRNPWVANLRRAGVAQIRIGRHTVAVSASELNDDEAMAWWPALTALWPSFEAAYHGTGERSVFALEPIPGGHPIR